MRKPDVEPLRPGILRGREVVRSVKIAQRIPFAFFLLVPLDIIQLGQKEQNNVGRGNTNEDLISTII
jgi:hypothetical protein